MKCARPVDFPTLYGALNIAYYDHNLAFEELKLFIEIFKVKTK